MRLFLRAIPAGQTESTTKSCLSKRRYDTRAEAKVLAKHVRRKCKGGALYVYQCLQCSGFHLTHKPRGKAVWPHGENAVGD